MTTTTYCSTCKHNVAEESIDTINAWNRTMNVCPTCGDELVARTLVRTPTATATGKPGAAKIVLVASLTPMQQYAKELTDTLFDIYGIEHHPTVFKNMSGSYQWNPNHKPQIVFGYESVKSAEAGFTEYPSLQYLVAGKDLRGVAGVHQLVIHEFAHVLQMETTEGSSKDSSGCTHHNKTFVAKYKQLMADFPYSAK